MADQKTIGLPKDILEALRSCFKDFEDIERAKLYGERIEEEYPDNATAFLLLKGNMDKEMLLNISLKVEQLKLGISFDIKLFRTLEVEEKRNILENSVDIYISEIKLSNFAVVLLNFNGQQLLETYLPKVIKYSENANIYVIDNGSTDNSVEFLEEKFPVVNIIQHEKNRGYAGGYQEGLKEIAEDYYCLLNTDVEVSENWLFPMKKLFRSDETIAAIQPKILDANNPSKFEYAGAGGGYIDGLGYAFCRGRIFDTIEEDRGQYDDRREVFWASGACLFLRNEAFWGVGGFDTDYFAHQEEIDLCWRFHNNNLKVYYEPSSVVYHVGGGTLEYGSLKKVCLNFRNSLFNLVKNYKGKGVILAVFTRLVMDGAAGLRFLYKRQFTHCFGIILAHISFYGSIVELLKKRRESNLDKDFHPTVKNIAKLYFIKKIQTFNKL